MATKKEEMERLIRLYKDETGKDEWDMKEVAKFAVSKGWPLPKPENPIDRLARKFSQVARDKIKYDDHTGRPYRAYHAFTQKQGEMTLHLWFDIDGYAPRKKMVKSLILRREQMVADGLQLTYDAEHWNNIHPNEEPIQIPMDFTEDISERKSVSPYDEMKKAS